jgi:hypothetical protein
MDESTVGNQGRSWRWSVNSPYWSDQIWHVGTAGNESGVTGCISLSVVGFSVYNVA